MLYASIWALFIVVQTIGVYLSSNLAFGYSFADATIFSALLALFIIPMWYPVQFNRWERKTWRLNLTAHIVMACVVVFGWLLAGYALCFLIGLGDATYRQFLNSSLWWKAFVGTLFYVVAVLMYYLHVYVGELNKKADNEIRLNKLLKDGELNLLKSQINPHFLFNSLNSVNSLIVRNPEQAQNMLVALSDYLRYAVLSTNRKFSHVAEEMENISRYLSIEQMRFGDRLRYEPDIDPSALNAEIPAMLLQPLFENAIKHGVYESLETVRITATINRDNRYLNIMLSNDYDEDGISPKKGSGTGLQNIRERLRLSYGTSAAMETKAENGLFIVVVNIPLTQGQSI